jgi:hypothetical protein
MGYLYADRKEQSSGSAKEKKQKVVAGIGIRPKGRSHSRSNYAQHARHAAKAAQ